MELAKLLYTAAGRSHFGCPFDRKCPGWKLEHTKAPIELSGLVVCPGCAAAVRCNHDWRDLSVDSAAKYVDPGSLGLSNDRVRRITNGRHVLRRDIHRTRREGDKELCHDAMPRRYVSNTNGWPGQISVRLLLPRRQAKAALKLLWPANCRYLCILGVFFDVVPWLLINKTIHPPWPVAHAAHPRARRRQRLCFR